MCAMRLVSMENNTAHKSSAWDGRMERKTIKQISDSSHKQVVSITNEVMHDSTKTPTLSPTPGQGGDLKTVLVHPLLGILH